MFGFILVIVLFFFGISLTIETLENNFLKKDSKVDIKDLIALMLQIIILLIFMSFIVIFLTSANLQDIY